MTIWEKLFPIVVFGGFALILFLLDAVVDQDGGWLESILRCLFDSKRRDDK
tara:strand:- start:488 stop:640 length:153 start_codon:yes stop_codon:yes gene_type:complete